MLALLSPSKTLDFTKRKLNGNGLEPVLFKKSIELSRTLKKLKQNDIKKLMDISDKLAELNYNRFQQFSPKMTEKNSKEALFAFRGDVYTGLDADTFKAKDIKIAQEKIAILSGLYGLVRPLNVIQPYRLEMGTQLKTDKGRNLYEFWGNSITEEINKLEKKLVVNLASNEYFEAVNKKKLKAELIEVIFKEKKNGKTAVIALFAKKARGLMARHIIENDANDVESLIKFNKEGYKYSKADSKPNLLTFIREHKQ